MNDEDLKLRERYKAEADETIFGGLQFDDRLKAGVRGRILTEIKTDTTSAPAGKQRNRRWVFGLLTAAAAILAIIVLPRLSATLPADSPNRIFTATDDPGQIGSPPIGIKMVNTSQSIKEAQDWFGEKLHLPAFVPPSFILQKEISVYGKEGIADKVTLSYSNGSQTFLFTVEKNALTEIYKGLEVIKIGKSDGYIDAISEQYSTVHWVIEDRLYSIMGDLPREDAVKVAESVKFTN